METLDVIKSRKSVREYLDKPIEESKLEQLVDIANIAPSAGPIHISVVTNTELLDKIKADTIEGMKKSGMDFLVKSASVEGFDPIHGAPAVMFISSPKDSPFGIHTAACSATTVILAALDMGLGTCYAASTIFAFAVDPSLAKELGIPDGFAPVCSVYIGYPTKPIEKRNDEHKDNITICK